MNDYSFLYSHINKNSHNTQLTGLPFVFISDFQMEKYVSCSIYQHKSFS